jgi:hypothetical protein
MEWMLRTSVIPSTGMRFISLLVYTVVVVFDNLVLGNFGQDPLQFRHFLHQNNSKFGGELLVVYGGQRYQLRVTSISILLICLYRFLLVMSTKYHFLRQLMVKRETWKKSYVQFNLFILLPLCLPFVEHFLVLFLGRWPMTASTPWCGVPVPSSILSVLACSMSCMTKMSFRLWKNDL